MEPAGFGSSGGGDFVVGCRLFVKTTLGEEFEGEVLTFDRITNCVVLQESMGPGSGRNLRFLKANFIKEFSLLGQSEEQTDFRNTYIDADVCRQREDAAIRQAEADAERIGIGVSEEGQDIFDALSKTLPVRWDKTAIVVMDDVRITDPYRRENCSGGPLATLERVQKVLDFERQRLQSRVS
ncbi:hypothetical protein CBR_g30806 [Chara braunii]|uniref:AD domain-containing protein n=1 Tax=Chara braunii TaxID=69332 RepID=A0A388JXG3_CHABU|nr:hypothetical protein CBR_g30806 [Chara braunii]|eukprot:GBG62486.1 hypothetical protein CBR_g30806 [Chara braunii]